MRVLLRWLTVLVALAIAVLAAGGWWLHRAQEREIRRNAEESLLAIARLKVAQVSEWRRERLADAEELAESSLFDDLAARGLEGILALKGERILLRFRSFQRFKGYRDICLVDATGRVRIGLGGRPERLHAAAASIVAACLRDGRPALTELHAGPEGLPPHVDVVAPLASGGRPLDAAVLLRFDARDYLYPLVQTWPTADHGAETLLVRRDGDEIVYLNDLRFARDAALRLRLPLSRAEVPAVQAVLGGSGIASGRDYRGVRVIAALARVPGSDWHVVAKMDENDALSGSRSRALQTAALTLLAFLAAALVVGVLVQRNEKAHFRSLFEAESKTRNALEKYRTTLLSVGDGVLTTDHRGRVELLNPVAERLTGWRLEEAVGRPIAEVFRIVNEETREPVESPVERVLREGAVVGLANHTLLLARDGAERPVADSGAPVRADGGAVTGVVLVFRDQTEDRARIGELMDARRFLDSVIDQSPNPIWISDAHGTLIRLNEACCRLLAISPAEVVGRYNVLEDDIVERQGRMPLVRSVFEEGRSVRFDLDYDTGRLEALALTSATRVVLDVTIFPIRDAAGRVTNAVIQHIDITERKLAEDARRLAEDELARYRDGLEELVAARTADLAAANHELEAFSYSVSHDLRAPVRAIDGFAALLEAEDAAKLDAEGRRKLAVIRRNTAKMGQLIDGLLRLSRIGRQELERHPVDMTALARSVLADLEGDGEVAPEVTLDELPAVLGDPTLLRQVWENLLGNAVKFARPGSRPRIEIEGRRTDSVATFRIKDEGVGFDMRHSSRLFGVFQRLHGVDEFPGHGLGLALVQRIVARHGGTVQAEGRVGEGATITFSLPDAEP